MADVGALSEAGSSRYLDIVDIPRYLGDGGVVVGVDEVDVVGSPAHHEDPHHHREHLH